MLAEDLPNFTAFVDSVDASRVTCLRYLRPLRDMAKQLGVRIVYEKMRLTGDENRIRIFLTLAYWLATDGAAWPFAAASHEAALALVHRILQAFELEYPSPVLQEVLAYHTTITQARITHGHTLNAPTQGPAYPVPNLFAGDARLTKAEQFSESEHLYQLNFLVPLYDSPGDPKVKQVLAIYQRYNPAMYGFVTRFLAQLPVTVLDVTQVAPALRDLIEASLLAIVTSVLTFGFDLGAVVAYTFNRRVDAALPDPQLEAIVQQTVTTALRDEDEQDVQPVLEPLVKGLYANILQFQRFTRPVEKVKVALMLEPVTLGFIDLVTFIDQQPFVELLRDHFESADVIIKDSSLPLGLAKEQTPLIFKWDMNASSDLFGELFALLHALQQEKI
ncbi:hypothetical protein [Lacticaseibacillus daqingensis]|uniref:hypothetical protein n=1 Tax=Lacticaseibacillus daqingensis TaxID=2486014 RepID=UPI000F79537D|nr:hypothetical protein [Lacticaseibacillus daqingensis]